MSITIERERAKVYLWIGLSYLALWLFQDLIINTDTFLQRAWNNVWLVAYLTVLNYVLHEHIITIFRFNWRKILLGIFLLWAFVMLLSFGFYAWRMLGVKLNLYFSLKEHKSTLAGVEYHFPYAVFSVVFFAIIKHWYFYRKLKETAQRLRLEKQEAELNYLKSQTNPHFLFNTLNNIYALSRDKSDLAPESILKLSKILRFMLYETSGDFIAVEQELKIMNDYISLEKLRYDDSLRVNFNYDVEDMKQSVPPLLLIPLVENAFKHGVSESRNQPFVDIHLSIRNRVLLFKVRNSADSVPEETGVKENIGLSNLRRQLELQYTDYSLEVKHTAGVFNAMLTINLSSHV